MPVNPAWQCCDKEQPKGYACNRLRGHAGPCAPVRASIDPEVSEAMAARTKDEPGFVITAKGNSGSGDVTMHVRSGTHTVRLTELEMIKLRDALNSWLR